MISLHFRQFLKLAGLAIQPARQGDPRLPCQHPTENRFGGIGSTPSFPALRAIPGWRDKFEAFWTLNPHPSFTQVVDITPPFDPDRPPHIAPVVITQEDLEAIVAYAASIEPKDLGAAVESR